MRRANGVLSRPPRPRPAHDNAHKHRARHPTISPVFFHSADRIKSEAMLEAALLVSTAPFPDTHTHTHAQELEAVKRQVRDQ